tara:strand:- start:12 stop:482 length:471 start_codon:yes stop_codon:yes gene_type:complete
MADLTVTITEAVTLNGGSRGSTNTLTVTGVDDVYHRIVTCPASADTTLAVFKSTEAIADGGIDIENTRYIRVTNLDNTNPVNLSLQVATSADAAAAASATILLEAGKSFLMGTPHDGIHVDDDAATIITSLKDLESILVDPGSNAVQMECFIALVV